MFGWRGEALVLGLRRHGEADAIAELLAEDGARWAAVVKGGGGRRMAATLQPGETVLAEWRARLDEHLGTARVEPARARAAQVMADGDRLAALTAAAALLIALLPEREATPGLYARTAALFDALAAAPGWAAAYARWELSLLADLGFGLDLSACAVTGATQGLAFVSPRSGRAVTREAGAPWADRLLPLPAFLRDPSAPAGPADVAAALRLTGRFIETAAAAAGGASGAPAARGRLAARLGA